MLYYIVVKNNPHLFEKLSFSLAFSFGRARAHLALALGSRGVNSTVPQLLELVEAPYREVVPTHVRRVAGWHAGHLGPQAPQTFENTRAWAVNHIAEHVVSRGFSGTIELEGGVRLVPTVPVLSSVYPSCPEHTGRCGCVGPVAHLVPELLAGSAELGYGSGDAHGLGIHVPPTQREGSEQRGEVLEPVARIAFVDWTV